ARRDDPRHDEIAVVRAADPAAGDVEVLAAPLRDDEAEGASRRRQTPDHDPRARMHRPSPAAVAEDDALALEELHLPPEVGLPLGVEIETAQQVGKTERPFGAAETRQQCRVADRGGRRLRRDPPAAVERITTPTSAGTVLPHREGPASSRRMTA